MFGNIKWTALLIALAITATVSFGSGVWVRDAFCDSAAAKRELALKNGEIAELHKNIAARDDAAKSLKAQSAKDAETLGNLQNEIEQFRASSGLCFSSGDVDGLRKLWGKGK